MKNSKSYIGLDIGGSKMEGILWRDRRIVKFLKIPSQKTRKRFYKALFGLMGELSANVRIDGIGVVAAGAIDLKRGRIIRSPNLPFLNGAYLRATVQKKIHKPVKLHNDAKGFLRAEMRFGQARGKRNVVALTLGTGVGGGAVINGKLLLGRQSTSVELGHIVISREGSRFLTLEDLVSSHGFRRLGVVDPLAVQNRGLKGDKKAIAIYRQIGTYLGLGLASLINIFDPELIILGGGISRADSLLLRPALREMRKHTLHSLKHLPPIKISKLEHAGALGAVSLFLP